MIDKDIKSTFPLENSNNWKDKRYDIEDKLETDREYKIKFQCIWLKLL